jgi:GMP synthase (glutamine-hydrolysing)
MRAATASESATPDARTHDTIVILDFGGQYTHLIARRVRAHDVLSLVVPGDAPADRVGALAARGIILSGGPASVYDADAPRFDPDVLRLGVPILGICFGQQLMAHHLGGRVAPAAVREFGQATLRVVEPAALVAALAADRIVWMSHGDAVETTPPGFRIAAATADCPHAAIEDPVRRLYGIQFHPEVVHTPGGDRLLAKFVLDVCGCRPDWTPRNMVDEHVERIRAQVGGERVLAAVSGGVDSTVLAALLQRAVPGQVECLLVDSGLLRAGEVESVRALFAELEIPLRVHDATDEFLAALAGVEDPEAKRKCIGHAFIRAFEAAVVELPRFRFLAQGTLYPDVIESSVHGGHSTTIKTHHNVGGLPADMAFDLVEPLRDLFKDEVRRLGQALGVPPAALGRHPFPGPGLAVRILGPVTRARLDLVRQCDAIFVEALRASGWYDRVWQAFAVLLPVRSVGVMGDGRTYEHVVALRAVDSVDGMTADWSRLPAELLSQVASHITNRVRGVNRVVYDVSSKPPGTIEWE